MKKLTKEQQQVAALVGVLAIIVLVVLYFYWPELLPKAVNDQPPPPAAPTRLNVSKSDYQPLFKREDFLRLNVFGDVPVKVLPSEGNSAPFSNQGPASRTSG